MDGPFTRTLCGIEKETIFWKNAFVAITFSNQIVRKRTLTLEEAFLYAVGSIKNIWTSNPKPEASQTTICSSYKAELLQLNRTQFPSLGIFVSKKVENKKN